MRIDKNRRFSLTQSVKNRIIYTKSRANKMLRFKGKAVEKQRRKAIGPYCSKAYGSQLQSYDLRCSFFRAFKQESGKARE